MTERTFTMNGAMTPAKLLETIRAQAPGLIREDPKQAHVEPGEPLLTPTEVATLFRVDPKTVTRWAKNGLLTSVRTLGGHRRYRKTEVLDILSRPADAPQQSQPGKAA